MFVTFNLKFFYRRLKDSHIPKTQPKIFRLKMSQPIRVKWDGEDNKHKERPNMPL